MKNETVIIEPSTRGIKEEAICGIAKSVGDGVAKSLPELAKHADEVTGKILSPENRENLKIVCDFALNVVAIGFAYLGVCRICDAFGHKQATVDLANLLANLANGKYDGVRNDTEQNGVSWGYHVDHGTPVKYREGRSRKYFDGDENVRVPGKRTETRYEIDEEKAEFLGKYSFLKTMFGAFPEVGEYSAEYYESRKGK